MTHDEEREHDEPTGAEREGLASRAADEDPTPPQGSSPEATAATASAGATLPSRPLWQRTVQLLLPAVLAAGAMGVHWVVNVPEKIVESPHDQGAKKAEKDKAKAKADKKRSAERRRAAKRDQTRTAEQLEADWQRYGTVPFDEEPTRSSWARRHQVVIGKAVVEAQRHAFAGAPEEPSVALASTTCRTVRCRFVLRSSFAHELDIMTGALERLREGSEPVWRSFTVEPGPAEPGAPAAEAKHTVQVTVAFATDETDAEALEIPTGTPEDDDEPEHGGDPNDDDA